MVCLAGFRHSLRCRRKVEMSPGRRLIHAGPLCARNERGRLAFLVPRLASAVTVLGCSRSAIIGKAHRLGLCSPEPTPVEPPALTEADFRGCRWIEGDPLPLRGGMFCCQPVDEPGGPWCERHHRIV
jgi:hypothetical protein